MASSSYCSLEERIIIHPIWVWLCQTSFKSATPWSLDSSPLCTQFRDPPWPWEITRAKYRSTHTSSSWPSSHGGADEGLLGDAFTQTYIHKYVYISIWTAHSRRIICENDTSTFKREKCYLDAVLVLYHTCDTFCTVRGLTNVVCLNCANLVGVKWEARVHTHTPQLPVLPFPLKQHWNCPQGSTLKRSFPHAVCPWGFQVPPAHVSIPWTGVPR